MFHGRVFKNFIVGFILLVSCIAELETVSLAMASARTLSNYSGEQAFITETAAPKTEDIWSERDLESVKCEILKDTFNNTETRTQVSVKLKLFFVLFSMAVLPKVFKKSWSEIGFCCGVRGSGQDYTIRYIHHLEGYNSSSI